MTSPIIRINNFYNKKPAWFYQRRKYRFPQLHKYRKSICALFRQTTNTRCLDNPINAPKIPTLGLKFSFPIHKFQTWKPSQKVLITDMRDSRSWTEILIFNHHLSGPLTSYYKFLLTKTYLLYKKKSIHKIYHIYYQFLLTKTPSMVTFN